AEGGKLVAALPARRSFRTVRTHARGKLDLRRSLREIVSVDGDIPSPLLRRRQTVPRKLLILIDVSGSMKLYTSDYLKLAHAAVQGAGRAEIFTFGTRLTRITAALRIRDRDQALAHVAALVDDWDGGTRMGPTLLAFLSVPRFSAFARGAAVVILSDALERGDHAELEMAIRRLSARAFRLSLATPLAGDPRFQPATAALRAILPVLDDLIDGSSIAGLTDFILSLARPAPAAAVIWKRVS
ncbi:MAG: VWA domain-containing protein, partial [Mesorhizobium sp.]|uniref:VWA domain-containing protein n=1 Tax=Mesorhizobium sp. TaxID=1871066 RepID=UPI000FE79743